MLTAKQKKERKAIENRTYRLAHKNEAKAYRLANKEKRATYKRAYRKNNVAKITIYHKAYYQANREQIKKHQKMCHIADPEKTRVRCRKRKALKLSNNHEPYTDAYIFERDGWICQICGQKINRRLKHPNPRSKSIDHIIPLSKGGSDSPINVQTAHLRCNMSKNAGNGGQLRLIG